MKYKQCLLKKESQELVTWIPEKFAKKNKFIKIKDELGEWTNGWKILSVYDAITLNEKQMKVESEAYKHQREVSDV